MKLPAIRGLMDRRILVNFKVDPAVLAQIVPAPLRPIEVGGHGIAGICLIRLRHLRPSSLPAWLGLGSENAAHRIAVEWDEAGYTQAGVYIPRRDTSSRISALAATRLFAGVHHHARFDVHEQDGDYRIAIDSDDRAVQIKVRGHEAPALPADSVFDSLEDAAAFFERGSLGFSPTAHPGQLEGVELCNRNRNVTPLKVDHVESNYFDDTDLFPAGTIKLDSALLMRGIDHDWKIGRTMCCNAQEVACKTHAR